MTGKAAMAALGLAGEVIGFFYFPSRSQGSFHEECFGFACGFGTAQDSLVGHLPEELLEFRNVHAG